MAFLESQEGFAEKNQIADAFMFYNIDFNKARQKKIMFVQLPRNFNFIQRLPSRFLMTVLSAGNKTDKGQWYKVQIGNQILNILSKPNLKHGQKVLIEKNANNPTLKIVKENVAVKENAIHETIGKATEKETTVSNHYDIDFQSIGILVHQLYVTLNDNSNIDFEVSSKSNNVPFSFKLNELDEAEGLFLRSGSNYKLILTLSDSLEKKLQGEKHIAAQIQDLLSDLNISAVQITDKKHLESLKTGLNYLQ